MITSEDIFMWPDGTWCYRHEYKWYKHMSDDMHTIYLGTAEYDAFLENEFGKNTYNE